MRGHATCHVVCNSKDFDGDCVAEANQWYAIQHFHLKFSEIAEKLLIDGVRKFFKNLQASIDRAQSASEIVDLDRKFLFS